MTNFYKVDERAVVSEAGNGSKMDKIWGRGVISPPARDESSGFGHGCEDSNEYQDLPPAAVGYLGELWDMHPGT